MTDPHDRFATRSGSPLHKLALSFVAVVALAITATSAGAQVLTASCLDPNVPLVVEEQRLPYTLPDDTNPAVAQSEPFAQQMIEGAGFQNFGPEVVKELCNVETLQQAQQLVENSGSELWHMAVNRAQQHGTIAGTLPYSDDRPLYWTRLQVRAALRQWTPRFSLLQVDQSGLITTFDRASRGMFDIKFPAGIAVKRLIMRGFDPYTLDGGTTGTAPGTVGNNIRHGNPSGAIALSLDGTQYRASDGTKVFIQAYILPVNYPEFEQGYLEDTVGPFMVPGPQRVNASVTVSQAGPYTFNLEQTNGRYHGVSIGNDNQASCPSVLNPTPPPNTLPQLAINNYECNSIVVSQWGGPAMFDLYDPPQWTYTSLPLAQMIAANTGVTITPPSGDGWTGDSNAFGVIWHTPFTEFPSCTSPTTNSVNSLACESTTCPTPIINGQLPPPGTPPTGWPQALPDEDSCSQSGGGGNYLSNESAYRNTLLRDRLGLGCPGPHCIPAGHIHTPSMQHFSTNFLPSDSLFDSWRLAIIAQGQNLIHVVADNAPKSTDDDMGQ
ncbi:MAG: hypothetical protein WBW31_17445 [Candidatus Sulfotelmatobacter sp.]